MLLEEEETLTTDITVPRDVLLTSLAEVNRFVPAKPNPAEFSGVMIVLSDDHKEVVLRTSNGVVSAQARLDSFTYDGPDVDGEQAFLVPAKILHAVVAGYPDGDITLRCDDNDIFHVVSGKLDYQIKLMDAALYPSVQVAKPWSELKPQTDTIDGDEFINSAVFAAKVAARDTNKPNLQVVNVATAGDGKVYFTATDTFQMIRYGSKLSADSLPSADFSLPLAFVEAASALVPAEEEVYVVETDNGLLLATDDGAVRLHCRGFQQKFPDISGILALKGDHEVLIDRTELSGILRRMRAYASNDNQRVTFTFGEVGVNISIKSTEGSADEDLTVAYGSSGGPVGSSFNFKLTALSDGINFFSDDELEFRFNGENKPVFIKSAGGTFTYMISLVR